MQCAVNLESRDFQISTALQHLTGVVVEQDQPIGGTFRPIPPVSNNKACAATAGTRVRYFYCQVVTHALVETMRSADAMGRGELCLELLHVCVLFPIESNEGPE